MAFDDDPDPERPHRGDPLPPDDRLWRHPSELAGGTPLPAAWAEPAASTGPRRSLLVAAMASACLTGAVVAVGVMWVARPTRTVVEPTRTAAAGQPVTTAVYSAAGVPSAALARQLAPSLVHVTAAQGDGWVEGTGVWLDAKGSIAVASAIVVGSTDITVTDRRGVRTRALLTGTDAATGISVLKVTGATGEPVESGQASAAAGDPVAVIGAARRSTSGTPSQRVVAASVSAVDVRAAVDPVVLHDALQLDRSLPSDALGGVAVDVDGHALGIVLSGSGTDRLAVLVPADEALAAARDLRDHGTVRRAWLGVRAVDLDPARVRLLGLPTGARLTQIDPGSPAEEAGLRQDDVITEVDDRSISGASDLVMSLRALQPGEQVTVTWQRGTSRSSAQITLGG